MKSFSNLAGFIEALKVGSTIKIVECIRKIDILQ